MAALSGAASPRDRALRGATLILSVYAQLLFARSPVTGGLLLLATALDPRSFVGGVLAVLTCLGCAAALGLHRAERESGPYGCNALLVGLGVARMLEPNVATWTLLVVSAASTVIVTASLASLLTRVAALPVLASAFLVVFPLAMAAAAHSGIPREALASLPSVAIHPMAAAPLESLGAILFLPRWDAGALVLLGLVVHSRIATLFAAVSLSVAWGLLLGAPSPADEPTRLLAGLNAMLTGIALGTVWFIPSFSSLVLGSAGAVMSLLFTVGLAVPLGKLGVPLLITPFYAAAVLALAATRQRALDAHPRSVDFAPGTPEENLRYYRTQRQRFASVLAVPIHLPFRGAWTCTQGVDGEHTHQAEWRFAYDFEVRGEDGELFTHDGLTPEDHHCHRLPVLAAADGTVASVEADLPDNPIGAQDLERNWGNCVLVYHAPGLYSLVAHLAKGSVRVQPGQIVRRGEVLGLCGSSGRSPRPHLHFQLQASPILGSPTLPCEFADVVRLGTDTLLQRQVIPALGDTVRGVETDEDVARAFSWPQGATWELETARGVERITSEIDLLGRHVLRSDGVGTLTFARDERGLVALDALGPEGSAVHLLRAALARVPFEAGGDLTWTDLVPSRWASGAVGRVLRDFVSPFVSGEGLEVRFTLAREIGRVLVTGASVRLDRRGVPLLTTRAVLAPDGQLVSVEVRTRGRSVRADRVERHENTGAVAHGARGLGNSQPWRLVAPARTDGERCSIGETS